MSFDVTPWRLDNPTWKDWQKKAQAQFALFWRGKMRRIEVRLVHRSSENHWFLLQTEPTDGIWVVTAADSCYPVNWHQVFKPIDIKVPASPQELQEVVQKATGGQEFRLGRLCYLPDGFEGNDLGIAVWPEGEGTCFRPGRNLHSCTAFRVPELADSSEWTAEAVRQQLIEKLHDPDSDLCFAAKWFFAWEDDRYRMIYPIYDQLREVMQWVLMASPDIAVISSKWRWRLHPYDREQCSLFTHAYPPVRPTLSADFLRWQSLMCQRLAESVPQQLLEQHPCAAQLLKQKPEITIIARVDPSAHDRLEALLKLREWFGFDGIE